MKVIIVGASGFVGGYLARELESAGHSTVKVDLPEVNLLDAKQVEALVENAKPDAVVNLAAISSVGASWKCPADTISVNVNGTLNLLEAVRKHAPAAIAAFSCKSSVFSSSKSRKSVSPSMRAFSRLAAHSSIKFTSFLATGISASGSSDRLTRMVSPMPSVRRAPIPTALFILPSSPSPASVTPRCSG